MTPYIKAYRGISPTIHESAFVAPGVVLTGNVTIGAESNIWFGCIIRGDVHSVTIGARTNIQDGTVIHVTRGDGPTKIGNGSTIGHRALLHACTLEDDCFIGMGAILLDNVVVESGAMVAAGAMVPPGKRVKKGEIWAGNPAKFFRGLSQQEADFIAVSAQNYVDLSKEYKILTGNR